MQKRNRDGRTVTRTRTYDFDFGMVQEIEHAPKLDAWYDNVCGPGGVGFIVSLPLKEFHYESRHFGY
jgi:hypothetical protein